MPRRSIFLLVNDNVNILSENPLKNQAVQNKNVTSNSPRQLGKSFEDFLVCHTLWNGFYLMEIKVTHAIARGEFRFH